MNNILVQSDVLILRKTEEIDLEFVLNTEHDSENMNYIGQQTIEEHHKMLLDEDILHLIVGEKISNEAIGYVMIAGIKNKNRSIELRRIVINKKGMGYGRETIKLCKEIAFGMKKAHRLWLDVRQHNTRAYALYKSEGFIEEGTLRECIMNEGDFESLIVLSILENEYLK
ncbi:GNAT family N-acetyltransferase [Mobilitalea sibirica]|uniref:GNAT family N-acetyltransferase n=1 Tax=Mobilitalea sibirica TaxID=1462919 RepID=A0A8J7KXI7_9FIRM|nr:GNAT family protein [Mobilitalea sibirica]MBH1942580.1 GNAT family N-acetyltransferase [Mobilitalea sibirica]